MHRIPATHKHQYYKNTYLSPTPGLLQKVNIPHQDHAQQLSMFLLPQKVLYSLCTMFSHPICLFNMTVSEFWGVGPFFQVKDVPLVEFMSLVFTCMPGCTSAVYVPCIYLHARTYLWRSLCPLHLLVCHDVSLVEFMSLVFTRMPGCTYGRVYVPCIYLHARMYLWWSLCPLYLLACQDVPLAELCTLHLLAFQVRVAVGDSGLCCRVCVVSFEHC